MDNKSIFGIDMNLDGKLDWQDDVLFAAMLEAEEMEQSKRMTAMESELDDFGDDDSDDEDD